MGGIESRINPKLLQSTGSCKQWLFTARCQLSGCDWGNTGHRRWQSPSPSRWRRWREEPIVRLRRRRCWGDEWWWWRWWWSSKKRWRRLYQQDGASNHQILSTAVCRGPTSWSTASRLFVHQHAARPSWRSSWHHRRLHWRSRSSQHIVGVHSSRAEVTLSGGPEGYN